MFWIPVEKNSNTTLIKQIYNYIREKILKGELKKDFKLPSSRQLSKTLNISRNVVLEAYEQLIAEGFLESVKGSGTFVAEGARLEEYVNWSFKNNSKNNTPEIFENNIINFRSGIPALNLFPKKKWGQIMNNVCLEMMSSELGYGEPSGSSALKNILCEYLIRTRGIKCCEENIIITSGAVQAIQLVTKLLLSEGDTVIVEDPSNYELQRILTHTGSRLLPVQVDKNGIITDKLSQNNKPKFIYVTPSHQFPIGGMLPIQRRIDLIKYAREKNCYIVEDDYDSEFRHEGPPVSSLQGLEPDKVIYIGTFSKTMFPALRIGYMVLPLELTKKCSRLKRLSDFQTPIVEQLALANFIKVGLLEKHISKMKKIYFHRRQKLIECLEKYFGDKIEILGYSTGIHLVVNIKYEYGREIHSYFKKENVRAMPVEVHSILKASHRNKFILGYGNLDDKQIEEGVIRLKRAFDRNLT